MKSIYLAFCSVIPWGLEPQSKDPESFILSIELRNQMRCKDNKKNSVTLQILEVLTPKNRQTPYISLSKRNI